MCTRSGTPPTRCGSAGPRDRPHREGTAADASAAARDEKGRRKAMLIRAPIYIAGTHLFAGFVILLLFLDGRRLSQPWSGTTSWEMTLPAES
ncbi:DUF6126 family protein [Kitasatospora sp. NPDC017646]|uniref:DUF6126 family protein n=1 Tax=Kitasatospora sp. NPDC017646 TaxID=3364024 RepID=UPI0037B2FCB9